MFPTNRLNTKQSSKKMKRFGTPESHSMTGGHFPLSFQYQLWLKTISVFFIAAAAVTVYWGSAFSPHFRPDRLTKRWPRHKYRNTFSLVPLLRFLSKQQHSLTRALVFWVPRVSLFCLFEDAIFGKAHTSHFDHPISSEKQPHSLDESPEYSPLSLETPTPQLDKRQLKHV